MSESSRFDRRRLREHGKRLLEAGYRRHSLFLSPAVAQVLEANRQHGETLGAVIERLLCPRLTTRPPYGAAPAHDARQMEREFRKRIRSAQNELEHSQRNAYRGGPITTSITLYREDRTGGVIVTNAGVFEFEGEPPQL